MSQRQILVVDDNEDAVELLSTYLAHSKDIVGSVGVLKAADAYEGLELAGKYRPLAVFTDIMMPGMDGYEFASRLRNEMGYQGKIFAISGNIDFLKRNHSDADAIFTSCLQKPIDYVDFVKLLSDNLVVSQARALAL